MKIGVPKEIKVHEYRVGLIPGSIRELTLGGHEVLVQSGAGLGIGCPDSEYVAAGARIVADPKSLFDAVDMIVKVKEPQLPECAMLHPGQVLFTYLHLAADKPQALALMQSKAHAIAYETVERRDGSLPLLTPMSEVAGRMSVQVGAMLLQKNFGGLGVLLGGVPGTPAARVLVIGGGVSGAAAAEIALGMRASVTLIDKSLPRLRELDARFSGHVRTLASSADILEREVAESDLVIGAVLIPGAAAPKLVSEKMVASMRPGSVLIDIAIDQGGCFATSKPTTHSEPTYQVHGVTHYCVTNMPGAVPRTSAFALNAATLPYVKLLADLGLEGALSRNAGLKAGLNVSAGKITCKPVADALGL
jgi:alanine dehydrogenase